MIAHIRRRDNMVQPLREHCVSVAKLCSEFGAELDLAKTAYLIGIMHDILFKRRCSAGISCRMAEKKTGDAYSSVFEGEAQLGPGSVRTGNAHVKVSSR